jgi:hypothetical protein
MQRCDDDQVDGRQQEDVMHTTSLLDWAGRRRSPATLSSVHPRAAAQEQGADLPGINFTALDRQHLKRARYDLSEHTIPEEVTAE